MKLTNNEKILLVDMVLNPRVSNKELSEKLKITPQAVGKIKENLRKKEVIKRFDTILDYDKIGIKCFVLTLVKIMPKVFRSYKKEIKEVFSHPNIITLINIPQTSITNIILFGFRDVTEYDNYFNLLQSRLPGLVEIKESFVFSNESFVKNSASELFIEMVKEFGEKDIIHPKPPKIEQNK